LAVAIRFPEPADPVIRPTTSRNRQVRDLRDTRWVRPRDRPVLAPRWCARCLVVTVNASVPLGSVRHTCWSA
jgi:hypothetical protein